MAHFVQVTRGGQITIPADMRRKAGIEIGDDVVIRLAEGCLLFLPKDSIDKDQAWFWSKEWQAAEREAEEDLRAGRAKTSDTVDELIADLDADTEA